MGSREGAPLAKATARFRTFLREQGLRLTHERTELLRAALHAPRHFHAEELLVTLQKGRRRISRATAYRTLGLLEQCGILRRSLLGTGRGRYETALGEGHHDHLVCAGCGQIEEFFEPRVEALQAEIAARFGYQLADHTHELFGICRNCTERGKGDVAPDDRS